MITIPKKFRLHRNALIAIGFLLLGGCASAQNVITTIAGTDWLLPAKPLPALQAPLGFVTAAAVDSQGNAYLSDSSNNVVVKVTPAGTLSVVAGNGQRTFSGDGGPATAAAINSPKGLAVDAAGNLYIADRLNNRVRKVDANGVITTLAGNGIYDSTGDNGPATKAALAFPSGVAADAQGNVYIADSAAGRIRRVTPAGIIATVAGNGTAAFSGDGGPATSAALNGPLDVAVDLQGNLYIADTYNNRVRKVVNGAISTVAGTGDYDFFGDGGPATRAAIRYPWGLAVDASGNLFIADTVNDRIRRVDTKGTISTVAGNGQLASTGDGGAATSATLFNPESVAADRSGNVFIADTQAKRLRRVDQSGIITALAGTGKGGFTGDSGPATSATLSQPTAVAADSSGAVYICDSSSHAIRRVGSDGTITTVAGNGLAGFSGDGGPASSATLNQPEGIALDSRGNLYIADRANNRIRVVTLDGKINTFAGNGVAGFSGDGGPANGAALNQPRAIAFDQQGNLYIADSYNYRLRKVTADGRIATFAGYGAAVVIGSGVNNIGDGGLAVNAGIWFPGQMVISASGTVYFCDTSNNRIRRVTSDGFINTVAGNGTQNYTGDNGPATSAGISSPMGIALDSQGNLYISDFGNALIRRVAANGIITTIAGLGSGFSGDGGPANLARVWDPYGLGLDARGNLLIADSGNYRVRAILASAPTFQAGPATLSLSAQAQGSPVTAFLSVNSSVPGLPFVVDPLSSRPAWLQVSPAQGTAPAALRLTADPSNLAPGDYSATLLIQAAFGAPATQQIQVALKVLQADPPKLAADSQSLTFGYMRGATAGSSTLNVSNAGGGTLNFTAAVSTDFGLAWLSASASSGTASHASPVALTVTATPGNLAVGAYSGNLTLSAGGNQLVVPVTMTISDPKPKILLSQTGFAFTAVAGGNASSPQSLGILNGGQGTMDWSAQATTLSGGAWLQLGAAGGRVVQPLLDVSSLAVSVNSSGLASGEYYGQVAVTAAADNSPQIATVILKVLPANSNPGPEVRPSGLVFVGTQGNSPGSQDVTITNLLGKSITYASARTTFDGTAWFANSPASSTIAAGNAGRVVVQPDFTKLTPGVRQGALTLMFDDGTIRTVGVVTVVAPAGNTASLSKTGEKLATNCGQPALTVQFTSPSDNFNATQVQPIQVKVVNECGAAPDPAKTTVTAQPNNGDATFTLRSSGNGVWENSWTPGPGKPSSGQPGIRVVASSADGGNRSGQAIVYGTLAASTSPLVPPGALVHAASFAPYAPVAPGGLITLYGLNLADKQGTGPGLPLPQLLNGTQVLLAGLPLPLLYTSGGQLNAQVPYDLKVNVQQQVVVRRADQQSQPQSFTVAAAQPGIFTVNQQGFGQGVILRSDQVTLAQAGTPANRGEIVVIYCAGLGLVTPAVAPGDPAPVPAATTVNPVTVTIGGKTAQVLFSGLTAGFAGLYQINAIVPLDATTGDTAPVTLTVAGQLSKTVTMALR